MGLKGMRLEADRVMAATKALPSLATAKGNVVNMVKNLRVMEPKGGEGTEVPSSPSSKINLNFGFSKQIRPQNQIGCKNALKRQDVREVGANRTHLCQIATRSTRLAGGRSGCFQDPIRGSSRPVLEQHAAIGPKRSPMKPGNTHLLQRIRRCRSACSGIGGEEHPSSSTGFPQEASPSERELETPPPQDQPGQPRTREACGIGNNVDGTPPRWLPP